MLNVIQVVSAIELPKFEHEILLYSWWSTLICQMFIGSGEYRQLNSMDL